MSKVLLIHNIMWSHYKAIVFSKLYELCKKENIEFLVIQIALNEKGRKKIGDIDLSIHNYKYKLLFEKSFEETFFFKRILKLINIIATYEPHIIILPGWSDISYWISLIYCKIKGIKLILNADSTEFDHKRVAWKENIKKIMVRLSDAYMCYGKASFKYLKNLGAPEKKIIIRYQATDNETLRKIYEEFIKEKNLKKQELGLKERNFIFVGRLSPEKNIETLIRAYCIIKSKHEAKDWGLIIVGDGPQKNSIKKLTKELKLYNDIYFAGGVGWKEVIKYYALADVFILPSTSETWGLVLNEAMVCNLPVVVSKKAGAYYDLVEEGVNGFGFNPYDYNDLVVKMLKFVKNEVDINIMGEKSYSIIKKYNPDVVAQQMLESFKLLLNENLKSY